MKYLMLTRKEIYTERAEGRTSAVTHFPKVSFFLPKFAGLNRSATAGLTLCVNAGSGAGDLKVSFVRKLIFEAHLQLVKY